MQRPSFTEVALRNSVVALTAFLTVVDLFAAQAILPSLARAYHVAPAAMGLAVNSSTLGMAAGGLGVAWLGRRLDRRRGMFWSLALQAIPTTLLAFAPGIAVFTLLRITQGVLMASAFTLALAYLGEELSADDAAGAFAAYITGNVASNLVGRLVSAAVADHFGLAANFFVFATLNLAGAILVTSTIKRTPKMAPMPMSGRSPLDAWKMHFADPRLRAAFGIGFLILFAFIGTFTYVNFVLIRPPFSVSPMQLGFAYLVFLPSIVTTPLAGLVVNRLGTRATLWSGLAIALAGLALAVIPQLSALLAGLVLVGVGTFLAQATATGFVGRAASSDRGTASGLYLASYFFGGLVGSAVLGQIFDHSGWTACVIGIASALVLAAVLGTRLRLSNS